MHQLLQCSLSAPTPIVLPTPKEPSEYFASIVRSIIGQQISTKAAAAVQARVQTYLGEITPECVQHASFATLKACGLSNQKTKYIVHNAAVWPEIPYADFQHLEDEAVITELTQLYGIGRWTAEMFLLFSLARPDVFSYGDLGLRQSLYRHYNFKPHYVRKIKTTVDGWSPHRSLASLALWHTIDNAPVLL